VDREAWLASVKLEEDVVPRHCEGIGPCMSLDWTEWTFGLWFDPSVEDENNSCEEYDEVNDLAKKHRSIGVALGPLRAGIVWHSRKLVAANDL